MFVTGNSGRESVPFIIACLVVFMLFNAGGLQLMGWLTGSETYPLAVRPAGTAAQSAALWGTNLLITLTLLTLISGIGVGPAMWLYGLFNVAAWLFVYFRMPDLTGRSLEEIEGKLSDGRVPPSRLRSVIRAEPTDRTSELASVKSHPMSFHNERFGRAARALRSCCALPNSSTRRVNRRTLHLGLLHSPR